MSNRVLHSRLKRRVGYMVLFMALAGIAYSVVAFYSRPMFCVKHEGHFGSKLRPFWEVMRPIRDSTGPIAFTDADLNLMVVFLADSRGESEPWPISRGWLSTLFDVPGSETVRIWRQRDRLLVVDGSATVTSIEISGGTVTRVRTDLFNLDRDKRLLNELERVLAEPEAAQLRMIRAK